MCDKYIDNIKRIVSEGNFNEISDSIIQDKSPNNTFFESIHNNINSLSNKIINVLDKCIEDNQNLYMKVFVADGLGSVAWFLIILAIFLILGGVIASRGEPAARIIMIIIGLIIICGVIYIRIGFYDVPMKKIENINIEIKKYDEYKSLCKNIHNDIRNEINRLK